MNALLRFLFPARRLIDLPLSDRLLCIALMGTNSR